MRIGIIADFEATPIGARFPTGWVTVPSAGKNGDTIEYFAYFYAGKVSEENGYLPIMNKKFTIPYSPGDPVELAYAHLMSLDLDETKQAAPEQRVKVNLRLGQLIREEEATPDLPEAEVV